MGLGLDSKAGRILSVISEYIGGELRLSKSGVPHLVLPGGYSACYFGKGRFIRVFSGYKTADNEKYRDFKEWTDLVRHFHYDLGVPWIGHKTVAGKE